MRRILAIDIGRSAIKALLADTVVAGSMTILNHGGVPAKGFEKGVLANPDILGRSIQQAVECTKQAEGGEPDVVVAGISGMRIGSHFALGSVAVKSGYVQQEDMRHVNHAAALAGASEGMEVLHVVPKQYRIDGCVCEGLPLGQRATVLECECSLIMIAAEELEKLKKALEFAGLKVDAIVANIFAVNEMADVLIEDKSYILVDIGAGNTDFVVYEDGNFVKAGSLPIGGEYITKDIMQGTELDFFHAERLKYYFGKLNVDLKGKNVILDCSDESIPDKNVQYDFLYDIIYSRVNELTDIFCESLSIDLIDREIPAIYLTGGSSLLYNFMNCLNSKFNMDVKLLNIEELPVEYQSPANAAAYGILQYAGRQFGRMPQQKKHPDEEEIEPKYQSIVHRIKSFLHL